MGLSYKSSNQACDTFQEGNQDFVSNREPPSLRVIQIVHEANGYTSSTRGERHAGRGKQGEASRERHVGRGTRAEARGQRHAGRERVCGWRGRECRWLECG